MDAALCARHNSSRARTYLDDRSSHQTARPSHICSLAIFITYSQNYSLPPTNLFDSRASTTPLFHPNQQQTCPDDPSARRICHRNQSRNLSATRASTNRHGSPSLYDSVIKVGRYYQPTHLQQLCLSYPSRRRTCRRSP